MKIGIISINMYSKGLNFACPLHTYAFQQFLLKNGIESTVINYKPVYYKDFDLKHPYDFYSKRYTIIEKKEAVTPEEIEEKQQKLEYLKEKCEAWKELYKEREIRYEKFQSFIDTHYIKTKKCYDSDLLEVVDPGFDCYICATDVIWKKEPGFGYDRGFFLGSTCMENKWKIAYAGSCNTRKGETEEDEKEFFRYLDDIDKISVREASLKEYVESKTNRNTTLVADPVLLHEKNFYEKLTVKPQEEHYLLLYYVMEQASDTLRQAVRYAKAHNLIIVELTERSEKGGRLQEYEDIVTIYRYAIGIEEWLGYIQYADCIFTNSFHACCFCALFEKKFFVGKRFGDKIDSVLNKLGLSDRRFDAHSDLINNEPPEIDYEEVGKKLTQWREESSSFILDAIHEAEGKIKAPRDYETYKRSITYRVLYNSGVKAEEISSNYPESDGTIKKTSSGKYEFWPKDYVINNGESVLKTNQFILPDHRFKGWRIRIKIDNRWFWYLKDGSLGLKNKYTDGKQALIKLFEEEAVIPYIPVNRISAMVAEAVWQCTGEEEKTDSTYKILYNSGIKNWDFSGCYNGLNGIMKKTPQGAYEFCLENSRGVNNGETRMLKNQFDLPWYEFAGWKLRFRKDNNWFWYLEDDTVCRKKDYNESKHAPIKLFADESLIPRIPVDKINSIVLVAVWKQKPTDETKKIEFESDNNYNKKIVDRIVKKVKDLFRN